MKKERESPSPRGRVRSRRYFQTEKEKRPEISGGENFGGRGGTINICQFWKRGILPKRKKRKIKRGKERVNPQVFGQKKRGETSL